jgi:pyruvate/2-oxoglutarate dehydrogenase complex dihydrolipoamide acyltransferase (E2) component
MTEIDATDSAIKLAKENNIDLASVKGSGDEGRILKPDVEKLIPKESDKDNLIAELEKCSTLQVPKAKDLLVKILKSLS